MNTSQQSSEISSFPLIDPLALLKLFKTTESFRVIIDLKGHKNFRIVPGRSRGCEPIARRTTKK
jgi:hypothetical protein